MWGAAVESDRIFILQKRIIRHIFSISPMESCRPLFRQFSIFSFFSVFVYECVIFVKQNGYKFSSINNVHHYPTRNNENIFLNNFTLSLFKKVLSICVQAYIISYHIISRQLQT